MAVALNHVNFLSTIIHSVFLLLLAFCINPYTALSTRFLYTLQKRKYTNTNALYNTTGKNKYSEKHKMNFIRNQVNGVLNNIRFIRLVNSSVRLKCISPDYL